MNHGIRDLRRFMTLGAIAGLILGGLSVGGELMIHLPQVRAAWLAVAFGAGLLGVAGASIFGALGFVVKGLLRRFANRQFVVPVAGSLPEIERSVGWAVWLVCAVCVTTTLALARRVLTSLQDVEFVADLLSLLTLLGLVLLPAAAYVLWRIGRTFGIWLHARGRYPWPRSAALRSALFVALPVGAWLYSLIKTHGGAFGALGWLPLVLILGLLVRVGTLLEQEPKLRGYADHSRVRWAAGGIVVLSAAAAAIGLGRWPAALGVLETVPTTRLPLSAAIAVTDVDRDGYSALFGGADCSAFRADVHPGASERAGNGVDEDCDDQDSATAAHASPALVTFSGALPAARIRPYNVVLIVVDALRADYFGRQKNGRSLTPFLDRFALKSLVFEQAYSQSSSTRISFPSFLTGRVPGKIEWKKRGRRYQIQPSQPTLQQALKKAGYRTGFVATKWFTDHVPSVPESFDVFRDAWMGRPYEKARRASAASTTARAIEFVEEERAEAPFFLTLYYEGPHAPYHDNEREGFPALGNSQKDLYASEISLVDGQIGFLLSYLQAKPKLWRDTVVLITADHGEEFGEHGGKHHSRTCHAESLHVPLLVRIPKSRAKKFPQLVSLVDIVPTILELTGNERAIRELDGLSLLHALGAGLPGDRASFCAIFGDEDPQATLKGSIRSGGLALLRTHSGTSAMLFDRNQDPTEQRALPEGEFAQERAQLRASLDEFLNLNFVK